MSPKLKNLQNGLTGNVYSNKKRYNMTALDYFSSVWVT